MNKTKYYIGVLLILFTVSLSAQTTTPEANFAIYQSKLKKSEAQKTDEKKSITAKFWLSRADLMMNIFEVNRNSLKKGTLELQVIALYPSAKKKQTTDEDGNAILVYESDIVKVILIDGKVDNFTEKIVLYETPLPEAFTALGKAEEFDVEGKLSKRIKEQYDRLKDNYELLAIQEFLEESFSESFASFAAITTINEKAIMEGVVDTTFMYYAGMAATRAEMTDEAIEYFEKARSYNYPEADVYFFLKQAYFSKGDTAMGVQSLEQGVERFPDNQNIMIELINFYLEGGQEKEALEYLLLAQKEDPGNLSLIFAEATLYDKSGETEKALSTYKRCLELDPEYFNAYYNLGVMFYNMAVEEFKKADEIRDPKEYDAAKLVADGVLKESLPYMEKAHEINPEDYGTLETLKTLYYRMENIEKYNEVKEKLEALPEPAEEGGLN